MSPPTRSPRGVTLAVSTALLAAVTPPTATAQPAALCANPSHFTPAHVINTNFTCADAFNQVASVLQTPSDCDVLADPSLAAIGFTRRASLWTFAAQCCTAVGSPGEALVGQPDDFCGTDTFCNARVQLVGDRPFPLTNTTCATFSASVMAPFVTTANCSADVLGLGSSVATMIEFGAASCCVQGSTDQNTACGPAVAPSPPPPAPGALMCGNPSDFTPAVGTILNNCSILDAVMQQAEFYGNGSTPSPQCDLPVSDSDPDSVLLGDVYAYGSALCCGVGTPVEYCPGRTSPCADPTDFDATAVLPLFGNLPCPFAAVQLGQLTSSAQCNDTAPNSTTVFADVLHTIGEACCGGAAVNPICGTRAPTAPPPPPPPRVGPTSACPGSFSVHPITDVACSGPPLFAGAVGTICGASLDSDNLTEYVFLLSNGGACAQFRTPLSCFLAVANIEAIVAGNNVSAYVPGAECFLDTRPCAPYPAGPGGFTIQTNPNCPPTPAPTAAPTTTPTSRPTTPTEAPTAVPTTAPTVGPTSVPTSAPVAIPTTVPTTAPTITPTEAPTDAPTESPTDAPTVRPTAAPTAPTEAPTAVPTETPSTSPSVQPTAAPTTTPTATPTAPTASPTEAPTGTPTAAPTAAPSQSTASGVGSDDDDDGVGNGGLAAILAVVFVLVVVSVFVMSRRSGPPAEAPAAPSTQPGFGEGEGADDVKISRMSEGAQVSNV